MPRRKHSTYAQRPGEVYVIHFDKALQHAEHYVGFAEYMSDGTSTLAYRIGTHLSNHGSKLMAAVNQSGIGWDIALVISGNQAVESRLHKFHRTSHFCPICMSGDSDKKANRLSRFLRNLFKKADADWTEVNDYQVYTAVQHHARQIGRPYIHYYLATFHGEDIETE